MLMDKPLSGYYYSLDDENCMFWAMIEAEGEVGRL